MLGHMVRVFITRKQKLFKFIQSKTGYIEFIFSLCLYWKMYQIGQPVSQNNSVCHLFPFRLCVGLLVAEIKLGVSFFLKGNHEK